MSEMARPDICVIGGGSGGLSVAAAAAAFGVSVILVERGRMGGDCLNYGCVPSKALIAAAKSVHTARTSPFVDRAPDTLSVNFDHVRAHVRRAIEAIAPNDSVERFTALGVRVIEAEARFVDRRTVAAGGLLIRARRFVVATGSTAAIPPVPGLEDIDYLTNESLFDLERLPRSLAILGGGPIGMEMAQAFRRLGSEVTVIEAMRVLGREDRELASVVTDRLRREGVVLHEGTAVEAVEAADGGIRLRCRGEKAVFAVEAERLLVAAGRRPVTGGLDLDRAKVQFSARGIVADSRMRTSNRRVYAIGDVAEGRPQFTHLAGYHAGLVVRSILFRVRARENLAILPAASYTDPEIASIGLSEAEARKRHGTITILRWPFAENDRAQAEGDSEGLIKLVVGAKGRVLGVGIAGRGAGELITFWSLVIERGMRLKDLTGYLSPYPTRAEIGKRAVISYYAPMARHRWIRALVRFLRRLG